MKTSLNSIQGEDQRSLNQEKEKEREYKANNSSNKMLSSQLVRLLARTMLISLIVFVAYNEVVTAGSVSKKFMKGFLLGAYMAKHHKPVIVVHKKHG